ncbi:DUF2567 domain-containing protein [Gordonia sp. OPL2]|nr:DUF2567 domain-containing protein [Gordonia sp. OPL2]
MPDTVVGAAAAGSPQPDVAPAASVRRIARPVGPLVAVLAVVVLIGAVVGMVWAVVTPAMSGRVVGADSAVLPAQEFPAEFAAVGTFAVLLLVYGLVSVIVAWFTARSWRGPAGFGLLALATVLGSFLAAWIGTRVADWRFDDPRSAPVGSTFELVPDLWLDGAVRGGTGGAWVLFLCAPFAVAFFYLGFALASRTADLGVGDLVADDPRGDPPAPAVQPI